jgi:methylenetetrahydrofolate dehydrogenase (NADP+) / methenyltetrahydrofolate cyclohydrolase
MIFDNQNLKTNIHNFLLSEVLKLRAKPTLNIVQIGDNLSSTRYVNLKKQLGQKLGINVNHLEFLEDSDASFGDLLSKKEGLIFQLPIPNNFSKWITKIPSSIDVDMLGQDTQKLWNLGFLPPTVQAVDIVLKEMLIKKNMLQTDISISNLINLDLDLSGYNVVVIGQGELVGKPLIKYLLNMNATIINLNKSTKESKDLVNLGDIVLSGAGVPKMINSSWLKPNAIVIDVATSDDNGALVGDVDKDDLLDSIFLCPSPKGVGPITVQCLFWNLIKLHNLYSLS